MKDIKSNNFLNKKVKIQNFISNQKPPYNLYQKIIFLTIIFIAWTYLLNLDKFSLTFNRADIAWLLQWSSISMNADKIKDTTAIRPLKQVVSWGKVNDYATIKATARDNIDDSLKTTFPQKASDIIEKYKYVPVSKIWDQISDPTERESVVFYKRLITRRWTASEIMDKRWLKDTGSHAGVDFVTAVGTPIYSMANGIVINLKTPCPWSSCNGFGNYIVIATNYEWMIIATFYAHMDKISPDLKEWDIISRWQYIWTVGSTWNSTAPHLHFQINKIWELSQVENINMAKQLFSNRFNDVAGVKDKTYDPITFVEKKMWNNASSTSLASNIIQGTAVVQASYVNKNFRITDIKYTKIEKKLSLGDSIIATVYTTWSTGSISITTDNDVLKLSKYIISPDGSNKYEVVINWNQVGNWQLVFNDGENKKIETISVYDTSADTVGIWVNWPDKIYKTVQSTYTIYPVDKLWNQVSTKLKGKMTVTLQNLSNNSNTTIYDSNLVGSESSVTVNIKAPRISSYKISVTYNWSSKSFYASKTVTSDLFYDYSIKSNYWQDIGDLNDQGIVKWSSWKLLPNTTITKWEIITLIIRQRYWDDLEDFTDQMNSYMSKNWKFFSDISWTERYAPYIYMWFRDWIAKWTNGKIQADKAITKAELLTLFGRTYGISQNSVFTSWLDIKDDDWFKSYADIAKKYNLYPFADLKKFNADQKVLRINAFESLYRYINFDTSLIAVEVTTNKNTSSSDQDKELEDAVKSIINY